MGHWHGPWGRARLVARGCQEKSGTGASRIRRNTIIRRKEAGRGGKRLGGKPRIGKKVANRRIKKVKLERRIIFFRGGVRGGVE